MGKQRLSVTVDSELLAHLDNQIGRRKTFATRSAATEAAIRTLLRLQREAAMVDYYAEQSSEDRADELAWGRAGARILAKRYRSEYGE